MFDQLRTFLTTDTRPVRATASSHRYCPRAWVKPAVRGWSVCVRACTSVHNGYNSCCCACRATMSALLSEDVVGDGKFGDAGAAGAAAPAGRRPSLTEGRRASMVASSVVPHSLDHSLCEMCKKPLGTVDGTATWDASLFCSQQCETFFNVMRQKGFGVKTVGTFSRCSLVAVSRWSGQGSVRWRFRCRFLDTPPVIPVRLTKLGCGAAVSCRWQCCMFVLVSVCVICVVGVQEGTRS